MNSYLSKHVHDGLTDEWQAILLFGTIFAIRSTSALLFPIQRIMGVPDKQDKLFVGQFDELIPVFEGDDVVSRDRFRL